MKKNNKNGFAVRVIAMILVALMVVSGAYYVIASIIIGVSAEDVDISDYAINGDTKKNIYVACGLHFSDDPEICCMPSAPNGFIIGETRITLGERLFTPMFAAPEVKDLRVSLLTFLKKENNRYLPTDEANAEIFPYHVELTSSSKDIWSLIDEINAAISAPENMVCIRSYIHGKRTLRYGEFKDASSASEYAGEVKALLSEKLPEIEVNISIPTGTGLCFIDATNSKVIFEFDNSADQTHTPAIYPINNEDGSFAGTTLASGYTYFDAITFLRYGDVINTTNMVNLETYVQGVLPSEIYTSWPMELQKAFSIIVRSYTLSIIGGKHYSKFHVDMCATACCQAYKGRLYVSDKIEEAVNATKDKVILSQGGIATLYYAAVHGGESISNYYAWGGSARPYLPTQKTPWEKYSTYTNNRGHWYLQFTPQGLTDQLRSKGYTEFTSPIDSVTINSRAGDSNYIYSITFKDSAGHSRTLTKTSTIYGALGLKSGNFNIGKGSTDYFVDEVLSIDVKRNTGENFNPLMSLFNVITGDNVYGINSAGTKILTDIGTFDFPLGPNKALTENGMITLPQIALSSTEPDENGYYTAVNVYGDTIITTNLKRNNKTYIAAAPDNFIITGKGWGHGIGLSQYGANDLAQAGAEYDQIINAYYSNVTITSIKDIYK